MKFETVPCSTAAAADSGPKAEGPCGSCGGTGRMIVNANHLPAGFALWLGKAQNRDDGRSEIVCPNCKPQP